MMQLRRKQAQDDDPIKQCDSFRFCHNQSFLKIYCTMYCAQQDLSTTSLVFFVVLQVTRNI
jgi:hypothetical protein